MIELLLMIAAPIAYIWLNVLCIKGRIKLSIAAATLICLIGGIAFPVLASYIDIKNLPSNVRCATGSVGFAFLGMLITIVIVPLSAFVFQTISWYKRKKLDVAVKEFKH